ncbi:extracellular solute-binding protein [bacterium]|nr:extracellular solute-binding protein [bacterium]
MIKRDKFSFVLVVLQILGAFFLVGCNDRIDKTPDGKTILAFWHSYNDEEEVVLREIISEWEKKNQGFTVSAIRIPFSGHESKIRTALTVERGPDMARVDWAFVCELARKHALVDLGTLGFDSIKDQYLKAPLGTTFIDGKYWGIPDQTTGLGLFYNKKLFRDAGLDPERTPKTWDEFVEFAKKLTNSEKGTFGFAMENTLWWTLPFFNTFGAKVISEDGKSCSLNSPEAIKAMEFKAGLFKAHKVEAGAWRAGSVNPETGFLNGRYAMILMGPWNLAKYASSPIEFGVGLIPEGPSGTSTNVGGTDVVIFNSSKYPKESYNFLTFFTSPESQAKWCKKLNQIPVNLKTYDLVSFENKHLLVFMEQMKHALPNPIVTKSNILEKIVNPEMEAVLTGQKSAEDAFRLAARKVEETILKSKP